MSSEDSYSLFIPRADGEDSEGIQQLVAEVLDRLSSTDGGQGVRFPRMNLVGVLSAIHLAANDKAMEQAHAGGSKIAFTPVMPCFTETTIPCDFVTIFVRLWTGRLDSLHRATSTCLRAQRSSEATPDEVHQLTECLYWFEGKEGVLIGDCIMAAASVTYGGSLYARFDPTEDWLAILQRECIATSFTSLESFLQSPVGLFPPPPPSVHLVDGSVKLSATRVWLLEEVGVKWPLVIDPLGSIEKWLQARGFMCIDTGVLNLSKARGMLLGAMESGGQVFVKGVEQLHSTLLPLLTRKPGNPTFRLCLISEGAIPSSLSCSVVDATPDTRSMVSTFISEVLSVLNPRLEQSHSLQSRSSCNLESLIVNAYAQLQTQLAIGGAECDKARKALVHRRKTLARQLNITRQLRSARVDYAPVAVRVSTLYCIFVRMGVIEEAHRPAQQHLLTPHAFRDVLDNALRTHHIRPPTFVCNAKSVSALRVMTEQLGYHPSDDSEVYSVAHSVTASFLNLPDARVPALATAWAMHRLKLIPLDELDSLLSHHPVVTIDEVGMAREYKHYIGLMAAQAHVLSRIGATLDSIETFSEHMARARQIEARLTGLGYDVLSLAVLSLWGASPQCEQQLVDKGALAVYPAELIGALQNLREAVQDHRLEAIRHTPKMLEKLRGECEALQGKAEELADELENDVAQQLVYDLDELVARAKELKRKEITLRGQEESFGARFLEVSSLEYILETLEGLNYSVKIDEGAAPAASKT